MRDRDLIKISEMASLHGVSRQTLILYDKNGLLKPVKIAENGYRYYSVDQVPRLRQICLLKEMGVPLSDIRAHLDAPTPDSMHGLIENRRRAITQELGLLNVQLRELNQLDDIFLHVATKERNVNVPFVHWIPERTALFSPFPKEHMDEKTLHLALMDAWGRLLEAGAIPSRGFGTLLDAFALRSGQPLDGAGSIVIIPHELPMSDVELVQLPAGEYACMYKYAMPYDTKPAQRLLDWMEEQGLEPAGPVVDRCLLDSVFHDEKRTADFCRLEVLMAQ